MGRCFILLVSILMISSCKKEYTAVYNTDLSIELRQDVFNDSIHFIKNFNLTSSNDSVLSYANAKIEDENGNVFFDAPWREIASNHLILPERRDYSLAVSIYRNVNGSTVLDHTATLDVDNNKYPSYIKFNKIEVANNVLDDDGYYTVSNSYTTVVTITNSLEFVTDGDDEYDVDQDVKYLSKGYAPKSININLNNVLLPTKSHDHSKWRYYEITVYYPLEVNNNGQVVGERYILTKTDLYTLLQTSNNVAGVEYSASSYDSSQGGQYSATVFYEWIYE